MNYHIYENLPISELHARVQSIRNNAKYYGCDPDAFQDLKLIESIINKKIKQSEKQLNDLKKTHADRAYAWKQKILQQSRENQILVDQAKSLVA